MAVRYSYLSQKFMGSPELWDDLRKFVLTGDFTFGKLLEEFETNFVSLMNVPYSAENFDYQLVHTKH